MKKTLFFAVLAFAFAGFGLQAGIVHAQTTDNTASLQQQLDVAKATLVNLEMKAGMVPQGDNQLAEGVTGTAQPAVSAVPATTGLTASEIGYFDGVLNQLSNMLSELSAAVAANPNMSQAQVAAIASTLGSMTKTVSAVANQIALDEQGNGAPIAMTSPSTPTHAAAPAAGNGGTKTAAPTAQAAPATSTSTVAAAMNTAPAATAQASSFWSFTKSNWPVLAIIVLVIAILAILFWPEKEAKAPTIKSSGSVPPSKPAVTAAQNQQGSATNTTASKTPQASPMDQAKTAA